MRARPLPITRIADFGQFWPILASVFLWGNLYFCGETFAIFRDQSVMIGEYLSQKLTLADLEFVATVETGGRVKFLSAV